MQIILILVFFGAFAIFGLWRGFRQRSRGENVFYATAVAVSLVVLMLSAADVLDVSPTKALYEFFRAHGLAR
ncbi:MAG: hypothetical protein ACOYI5_00690 [Christensenellales bacterium]|jgi:NADH:ubiquinone oxidoreductase subunit 5 (subunit L)/multisubunit Na+/H+ antiporter MnhA subunit